MDILLLKNLAVALVLSLLVGLEREHKFQTSGGDTFGGVRTFALIGLMGALTYALLEISILFSAVLALGFLGILITSYWASAKDRTNWGITSELAAIIVFVIGIMSAMGMTLAATIVALVLTALLHFKIVLHKWAKKLKNSEIVAGIQFVLIAFVILPMLPNQNFGPYEFFNPYTAWLMVVLISGLSFISYIAIKLVGGKKGIGITGFLAGFISSTALTLSFSGQSKKTPKVVNPYVVAILIASSAMFFRVIAEIAVVYKDLLDLALWPLLVMGLTGLAGSLFFWLKKEKVPDDLADELGEVDSPLNLWTAIKFGAFFVGVTFLAEAASNVFGNSGVYITSVLSGVLDVDAITLSMSNLAKDGSLNQVTAVIAITIAAMTNTIVKSGIFLALGNRKVALRILSVMTLMLVGGGATLVGTGLI